MDKSELNYERSLQYQQLVEHLLKKYGRAKYDYFTDSSCKLKNKKVVRTSEGLLCHHIFENVSTLLSNSNIAKNKPFEYQLSDNLVYCNYLEHFLLHLAIAAEDNSPIHNYGKTNIAYYMYRNLPLNGGVDYIRWDCNYLYMNKGSSQKWQQRCFEEIAENEEQYSEMLISQVQYCIDMFVGSKEKINNIEVGTTGYHKEKGAFFIKDIQPADAKPELQSLKLQYEDHIETIPRVYIDKGNYNEELEKLLNMVSRTYYDEIYYTLYEKIKNGIIM